MIDLYRDRPDLYDVLHDAETGDVTFYVAMAHALVPSGGTVLELGCGTGRVMEALLEQGLQVTGLDGEPAMLAQASRRLARFGDRARLVQADMRRPELGTQQFDLVLVAANTFMRLPAMFNRHARGVRLLDEVTKSPLLASAPAGFKAAVAAAQSRAKEAP